MYNWLMEGYIGTYCQIWEQNLIVWTSVLFPLPPHPFPDCLCYTATQQRVSIHRNTDSIHKRSVMTLLGKYAPETIIELINSNYFLRILRVTSPKSFEIIIFCFAYLRSYITLTALFVCVLVGLGRGTRRCRSISC